MWMRWVIGLRNGPSTWPPSWQMSHIILSSSSTTMKSSKTSFSSARNSSSRSLVSPSPATRKVPEIGFIRTSPERTDTCRSGLAPMRYRSPVKKRKVQYAPRSRSISRRSTVSAFVASQSARTAR